MAAVSLIESVMKFAIAVFSAAHEITALIDRYDQVITL